MLKAQVQMQIHAWPRQTSSWVMISVAWNVRFGLWSDKYLMFVMGLALGLAEFSQDNSSWRHGPKPQTSISAADKSQRAVKVIFSDSADASLPNEGGLRGIHFKVFHYMFIIVHWPYKVVQFHSVFCYGSVGNYAFYGGSYFKSVYCTL